MPPHFAVPTEIRPSCGNKPLLRKQLNGHRRRGELRGLTLRAVERPFVLKMPPIAQTDDNRCSDFIYRAPVSLIKKPCYDRIYGLSRTMRCFMIQGGFMLMIRSGLPSGPLSGHLSAPSSPAALDTPIFLAPRPIHRLLVHLHFEIVTSRRQCAGKNCRHRIRYVRKPLEKDG